MTAHSSSRSAYDPPRHRAADAVAAYRWMVLARELDIALCARNARAFPCAGEEAAIVGSFYDLRSDDAVAPHYRDPYVVYLMRGAELWRLAAQTLGKSGAYNRGRSVPFAGPLQVGAIPWVAGDLGTTLGVATGAALAFQYEGSDRVCVCTFGDGTANRGDFHESVNLSACWKLPIVWVCQNNGWAISEPASAYLPAPVVSRAAGYGIPGVAVDGNDVSAVRVAVREAVDRARSGNGPTLIEAQTWRARGHWAADAGSYRRLYTDSPQADPIAREAERLRATNLATPEELQRIQEDAAREVAAALSVVETLPDTGADDLGLDEVYA